MNSIEQYKLGRAVAEGGRFGGWLTFFDQQQPKSVPKTEADLIKFATELPFLVMKIPFFITELTFCVTKVPFFVMEKVWLVTKITFSVTKLVLSVMEITFFVAKLVFSVIQVPFSITEFTFCATTIPFSVTEKVWFVINFMEKMIKTVHLAVEWPELGQSLTAMTPRTPS